MLSLLLGLAALANPEPTPAEPAPAEPAPAEPAPAEPVPEEPASAEPAPAEPAVPAPAPAEPTTAEPTVTGPATPAEPALPEGDADRGRADRGRRDRRDNLLGASGNTWMMAFGGGYGAYLGGTIGGVVAPGTNGEGIGNGMLLGGAMGLGTAAVFATQREFTVEESLTLGTGATLGSFTGIQIARALIPVGDEDELDRIALAGLLGSLGGVGGGVLAMPSATDRNAILRMDLAALVGWQGMAGAFDAAGLDPYADRRIRAPLTLAAAFGAAGLSLALEGEGDPPRNDGLMLTSIGQGAWLGLWTPYLITADPEPLQVFGAMRLGLGAGYLAGRALAPLAETSPHAVALMGIGSAAGNAVGAGLPLALGVDPNSQLREVIGPMLGGSIAGQAYGGLLALDYTLDEDQIIFATAMGTWTSWQALGLGWYAHHSFGPGSRQVGLVLTAGGTGGLLAMGLAPYVHLTPAETTMATATGAWGTWMSGWTTHLLRTSPDVQWASALAVSDLAFVTTAVAAPFFAPGWREVGIIHGMGLIGGGAGGLGGVVASPSLDAVAVGALGGSIVGLGAGAVLAARGASGGEAAASLALPELPGLPVAVQLTPAPWMDEAGQPGVWLDLQVRELPPARLTAR